MNYKVVRNTKLGFKSVSVDGEASIYYTPFEFAEASPEMQVRGHHPLVYDSLDGATGFAAGYENVSVWECECEEEVDLPPRISPLILSLNPRQAGAIPGWSWPDTVRSFRRVMITRRLK